MVLNEDILKITKKALNPSEFKGHIEFSRKIIGQSGMGVPWEHIVKVFLKWKTEDKFARILSFSATACCFDIPSVNVLVSIKKLHKNSTLNYIMHKLVDKWPMFFMTSNIILPIESKSGFAFMPLGAPHEDLLLSDEQTNSLISAFLDKSSSGKFFLINPPIASSSNGTSIIRELQEYCPGLNNMYYGCPAFISPNHCPPLWRNVPLWKIVVHLNDVHGWARAASEAKEGQPNVADWLDEVAVKYGWDLSIKMKEDTA